MRPPTPVRSGEAPYPGTEGSWRYPGWRVVLACFVLAVFSWGFGFYGQGIYLAQLRQIHGWSVGAIATATTAYYLLSAVLVAFAGDAMTRLGPRRFVVGGMLCLAAATALIGQVGTLPQFYAAYALMAVGWAATSVAAITSAIGPWFDAKRGLAISLALNGASAGGIVGAPALVEGISRWGFGPALGLGAGLMVLVLLPLLWAWMRWPPERAEAAAMNEARSPPRSRGAIRSRALGSTAFWTVTLPFAAALFVQVGFIVHQVSLIAPVAGAKAAGFAVGLTAIAAIVGRVGLGVFIDRVDRRAASAATFLVQVVALAIVLQAASFEALLAGSVLFGLSVGNVITLPSLIIHQEFEATAFATIVSLSTAIGQFAYAFGPGTIGWLRDLTGGYTAALLMCIAIDLAAAVVVLVGRNAGPPGPSEGGETRASDASVSSQAAL